MENERAEMENDDTIAFKIPASLKADFQRWCDDNAINMSKWFRDRPITFQMPFGVWPDAACECADAAAFTRTSPV